MENTTHDTIVETYVLDAELEKAREECRREMMRTGLVELVRASSAKIVRTALMGKRERVYTHDAKFFLPSVYKQRGIVDRALRVLVVAFEEVKMSATVKVHVCTGKDKRTGALRYGFRVEVRVCATR